MIPGGELANNLARARPRAPINRARPNPHANWKPRNQTAPNPAGGTAPPPGQQDPGNSWESDPIYQRILALQNANLANAQSQALAQRQSLLISFGYDPALAGIEQQYGVSRQAAEENSFSVVNNLARSNQQANTGINENTNARDLFYSSTRGKELQGQATNYLGQQAQAQSRLQGQLSGVSENLLNAQQSSQNAIASAAQDAYTRALNYALQYGLGPAEAQQAGQQAAAAVSKNHPAASLHQHLNRAIAAHPHSARARPAGQRGARPQ